MRNGPFDRTQNKVVRNVPAPGPPRTNTTVTSLLSKAGESITAAGAAEGEGGRGARIASRVDASRGVAVGVMGVGGVMVVIGGGTASVLVPRVALG